jgi:hypothetical protein
MILTRHVTPQATNTRISRVQFPAQFPERPLQPVVAVPGAPDAFEVYSSQMEAFNRLMVHQHCALAALDFLEQAPEYHRAGARARAWLMTRIKEWVSDMSFPALLISSLC